MLARRRRRRRRLNNQVSVFRSSCVDMYNLGNYILSRRWGFAHRAARTRQWGTHILFRAPITADWHWLLFVEREPKGARRRWRENRHSAYSSDSSLLRVPFSLSGHNFSLTSLAYASKKPSDIKHTEGITLSERGWNCPARARALSLFPSRSLFFFLPLYVEFLLK